jgi:hypothetical protein
MENFEKKYEEYKKNFYDNIDKENIEKEKEKLKEEIYDLIYKSIGYLDIDGIILESRKDAIDYKTHTLTLSLTNEIEQNTQGNLQG